MSQLPFFPRSTCASKLKNLGVSQSVGVLLNCFYS
uniref:Uncharacterized protein n=1 Tax=Anguilla anguilla TaxID=7936 RepID=A0A0E9V1P4_ANGAN